MGDTPTTAVKSTTLQHPPLPSTATIVERIVLPATFSVITSLVRQPDKAAELEEYMLALRDAINAAYPDAAE